MQNKKAPFNIIMGDLNAKVGGGDKECFAIACGFKIMDTFSDKKNQRRWTWRSPSYKTFNEIDYIMADKHQIVKNVEVMN